MSQARITDAFVQSLTASCIALQADTAVVFVNSYEAGFCFTFVLRLFVIQQLE